MILLNNTPMQLRKYDCHNIFAPSKWPNLEMLVKIADHNLFCEWPQFMNNKMRYKFPFGTSHLGIHFIYTIFAICSTAIKFSRALHQIMAKCGVYLHVNRFMYFDRTTIWIRWRPHTHTNYLTCHFCSYLHVYRIKLNQKCA